MSPRPGQLTESLDSNYLGWSAATAPVTMGNPERRRCCACRASFYDLFPLSRDRWGLFLGDICGKGARAATVTSMIRYTLRAAAIYDTDPATVLGTRHPAHVHRRNHAGARTGRYGDEHDTGQHDTGQD
jgi:hypothetical protein